MSTKIVFISQATENNRVCKSSRVINEKRAAGRIDNNALIEYCTFRIHLITRARERKMLCIRSRVRLPLVFCVFLSYNFILTNVLYTTLCCDLRYKFIKKK